MLYWRYALLTHSYRSEDKAIAQGFNDLLVFALMTTTAASSGTLLQAFGWSTLNWPSSHIAPGLRFLRLPAVSVYRLPHTLSRVALCRSAH